VNEAQRTRLIKAWLAEMKRHGDFRNSTAKTYKRRLEMFCEWLDERGLALNEVAASDVDAYFDATGWSSSTQQRDVCAMKSFYDWLELNGHDLLDNPVAQRKVRRKYTVQYVPTLKEVEKLLYFWFDLGATPGQRDTRDPAALRNAAMIVLLVAGGLRRSEAVMLQRRHITREGDHYLVRVPAIKSTSERKVPVGVLNKDGSGDDLASVILARYLLLYDAEIGLLVDDPLFPAFGTLRANTVPRRANMDERGLHALHASAALSVIKKGVKKLRLHDQISAHSMRRHWATWLLHRGMDLETLMRMGGWHSVQAMMPYLHGADTLKGAQISKLTSMTLLSVRPADRILPQVQVEGVFAPA